MSHTVVISTNINQSTPESILSPCGEVRRQDCLTKFWPNKSRSRWMVYWVRTKRVRSGRYTPRKQEKNSESQSLFFPSEWKMSEIWPVHFLSQKCRTGCRKKAIVYCKIREIELEGELKEGEFDPQHHIFCSPTPPSVILLTPNITEQKVALRTPALL